MYYEQILSLKEMQIIIKRYFLKLKRIWVKKTVDFLKVMHLTTCKDDSWLKYYLP